MHYMIVLIQELTEAVPWGGYSEWVQGAGDTWGEAVSQSSQPKNRTPHAGHTLPHTREGHPTIILCKS
jgi:hypothetical protein